MSIAREVEKTVAALADLKQKPIVEGRTVFDLSRAAALINPVLTPFRNITPRRSLDKRLDQVAEEAEGFIMLAPTDAALRKVAEPVGRQSLRERVIFESSGSQVDAHALATANLLRAFMIAEEHNLLSGSRNDFEATDGILDASPVAYNGLFAHLIDRMDGIHYRSRFEDDWSGSLSGEISAMAARMAGANGAPPDLCLIGVAGQRRITKEIIGDGVPYGAFDYGEDFWKQVRVSQLAVPGRKETIRIQAHHEIAPGEAVLLTTMLPEPVKALLRETGREDRIPAPWSLLCEHDYLQVEEYPTAPYLPTEIRLAASFHLHCPFLVGWIRFEP